MSFSATVFKVMIASPGDVPEERDAITAIVHRWNVLHAEQRNIVLLPVRWETHSVPATGSHPQTIINQQLVHGSDILVGLFGTRLGTRTEKADSGTIEEINEHESAGKPVMLYFSNAPVPRDQLDHKQLAAVEAYKKSRKKDSLFESYNDLADFKEKFERQLTGLMNQKPFAEATEEKIKPQLTPPKPRISEDALALLASACEDDSGRLMALQTGLLGRHISTHQRDFTADAQSAREFARWQSALNELVRLNLIEDQGYKGEVFLVTGPGWDFYTQSQAA